MQRELEVEEQERLDRERRQREERRCQEQVRVRGEVARIACPLADFAVRAIETAGKEISGEVENIKDEIENVAENVRDEIEVGARHVRDVAENVRDVIRSRDVEETN